MSWLSGLLAGRIGQEYSCGPVAELGAAAPARPEGEAKASARPAPASDVPRKTAPTSTSASLSVERRAPGALKEPLMPRTLGHEPSVPGRRGRKVGDGESQHATESTGPAR